MAALRLILKGNFRGAYAHGQKPHYDAHMRSQIPIPGALTRALRKAGIPTPQDAPSQLGGSYLLCMHLNDCVSVSYGAHKDKPLSPGWYIYAGSAYGPGGLRARISRHLRKEKPIHWHVDQLTSQSEIQAIALPGANECDLVVRLLDSGAFTVPAKGFGSTDCRNCESHLLAYA